MRAGAKTGSPRTSLPGAGQMNEKQAARKPQYGMDCMLLDAARRELLESCDECLKSAWLLQRRIKSMRGKMISPSSCSALDKQREWIDWLIAGLEDFKDYTEENEAWEPSEIFVFPDAADAAMEELLEVIGNKDGK